MKVDLSKLIGNVDSLICSPIIKQNRILSIEILAISTFHGLLVHLLKANSFLKWGYIENSKNTRILLGNCISKFSGKSWNFPENLGISKIENRILFIIREISMKYSEIFLKNPKLILEIPRFSRKFQDLPENFEMQLPSRILVFFEFSI